VECGAGNARAPTARALTIEHACPRSFDAAWHDVTELTRNGELAVVEGKSKIEIWRSSEDRVALVITLPNGREIAAYVPRKILLEPIDLDD
jgi:hypothetical protein